MAEKRASRDAESREAEKRETQEWRPPSLLPDPSPREGWTHRWVRVAAGGDSDTRNLSMKVREGWEPCQAEEYPEMASLSDEDSMYGKRGQIEIGGLLLCRAPVEMKRQRQAYYAKQNSTQVEAVEAQLMSNSDSRMPIQKPDSRSTTTFGRQ